MDIEQLLEAKSKFEFANKTFCWMGGNPPRELNYLLGSIGCIKNITKKNERVNYFVWSHLTNSLYNSDECYLERQSNMHVNKKYREYVIHPRGSTNHLSLDDLEYEVDRVKSYIVKIFNSQYRPSLNEKTAFEICQKIPFLVNYFSVKLRKKCIKKYNPLIIYLDKTFVNQRLKKDVIYKNGIYFHFLDYDEKKILDLIEAAIFSKKNNLPNLVENLKKIQILNLDFSLMHDKKIFESIWLRYKSLLNEKDPLILAAHKKGILDLVP